MSVDEFLKQLVSRGALSKKQFVRVREQLAQAKRPAQVEAVARGLVQGGLVTQADVDAVLHPPSTPPPELLVVDDQDDLILDLLPAPPVTPPSAPPPASAPQPSLLDPLWEPPPTRAPSSAAPLLPIDPLSEAEDVEEVELVTLESESAPSRTRRVRNRWDSPLILFGGGTVVALLGVGLALYLFLYRDSGDALLQVAEADYEAARYGNAVQGYEAFVKGFPRHPLVSHARVWLGLARIRQSQQTTRDWSQTLAQAATQLPTLEAESAFPEARAQLAGLLPDLAAGLVESAARQSDVSQKVTLLEQAQQALQLVENSAYLPTSQRKGVEGRLESIRENLQVVQRDVDRGKQVITTIEAMQQAVSQRQPALAYTARDQLLQQYPAMRMEEQVVKATHAVAEAETQWIEAISDLPSPSTDDNVLAGMRSVMFTQESTAEPSSADAPSADASVHVMRWQGTVYAFEVAHGKLLWRRYVGVATQAGPWPFETVVVLWHADQGALLGLERGTGKFRWRLPLAVGPLDAVRDGQSLLVSHRTLGLLRVDPNTGTVRNGCRFPRPIATAACWLPTQQWIAQAAEHSTVYLVDAETFQARGTVATGHAAGTVVFPPVALGGQFLLTRWATPQTTEVDLFGPQADGPAWVSSQEPLTLVGRQTQPCQALDRRRALLVTDRGVLAVVGMARDDAAATVQILASTVASTEDRVLPTTALYHTERIYAGNEQLSRYDILSARSEIVRRENLRPGYVHLAPLQESQGNLLQVVRAPGRGGALISAWRVTSTDSAPTVVWETEFATPRAASLIPDSAHRRLLSVSANAAVHVVSAETVRQGIAREPLQQVALHATAGTVRQLNDGTSDRTNLPFISDGALPRMLRLDLSQEATPLQLLPPANLPEQMPQRAQLLAGQLLVPTQRGPIALLDLVKGRPTVAPFQPRQEAESSFTWLTPAIVDEQHCVVADAEGACFALETDGKQLRAVKSGQLGLQLVQGLTYADNTVWASANQGQPVIINIDPQQLTLRGQLEIPAGVDWGPYEVGAHVWYSGGGELLSLAAGPTVHWRVALPTQVPLGTLIGPPLAHENRIVVATTSGVILAIDPEQGTVVDQLNLQEPLATGCTLLQDRLMVAGLDGTLFVLPPWPVRGN